MLKFLRDERGASAAEYALMLAVISAGVAAASMGLSGSMANAIDRARGEFAIAAGEGDETPAAAASSSASSGAAPEEGESAAGNNGKGNAYGHGKGNNGQGNAYGKTK